jgi:putative phage-type endonuclease
MSLTDKQLQERLTMITGSNAGTILGVNPYSSKYCMWATKLGKVVDTFKGNNKTDLGTWLEQFCVYKYEQSTGRSCRKIVRTLRHKKYPFIGGHLDRLVEGDKNRGLECKVVTPDGMGKWFNEDGELTIPPYYRAQVLHYALVTGRRIWDFSVVFTDGRKDPAILTVVFSQADLDDYLEKCIDFWKLIESETPPSIDDSKATAEALKKEWQTTDVGSIKVATDSVIEYLSSRRAHKSSKEIHESQIQLMENRLRNFMQDAESIVGPSGETIATCKADKNGRRRLNLNFKREDENGNHATAI